LTILFRPFGYIAPEHFLITGICLPNRFTLSVSDECYPETIRAR